MALYQEITLKPTQYPYLDLEIGTNGDFVISESSQQETNLILNVNAGNFFQYPTCGVGLIQYLASNVSALKLESVISQQLQQDGFTVQSIDVNNSNLQKINIDIEAVRK